jgi:hypothetical protein
LAMAFCPARAAYPIVDTPPSILLGNRAATGAHRREAVRFPSVHAKMNSIESGRRHRLAELRRAGHHLGVAGEEAMDLEREPRRLDLALRGAVGRLGRLLRLQLPSRKLGVFDDKSALLGQWVTLRNRRHSGALPGV